MEFTFLISYIVPDSKGKLQAQFFTTVDGSHVIESTTLDEIDNSRFTVVSFDFELLCSYWRDKDKERLTNLIDVEQLAKQLQAEPESTFSQPFPWSIWERLKEFYDVDQDDLSRLSKLYFGITDEPDENVSELFSVGVKRLALLFKNLWKKMEAEQEEIDRFLEVEKPIREITINRTVKGISVDTSEMNDWITQIDKDLYRVRNELQIKHSIVSTLHFKKLAVLLQDLGFQTSTRSTWYQDYYRFLKVNKENALINLLYQEKRLSANLSILCSIGALDCTQTIPIFDAFGTITARTKLVTPNFQYLGKEYRKIIVADEGKSLIYIDYHAFEAGILADLSGDKQMIKDYNNLESDIYLELAKHIFPEGQEGGYRSICKNLFYRYLYGAKLAKIGSFLTERKIALSLKPKIEQAFARFESVVEYVDTLESEAESLGKIASYKGNYRKYENDSENNWIISQKVQGTASYILKRSVIEALKVADVEFLFPLHDAAVFQVPTNQYEQCCEKLKAIFKQEFNEVCPKVNGYAKIKPFAPDEIS
jgi:DNA polymerase I-like protein with 3'-5' exonuclease and polymerase domains